jgi:hypothetical protein
LALIEGARISVRNECAMNDSSPISLLLGAYFFKVFFAAG